MTIFTGLSTCFYVILLSEIAVSKDISFSNRNTENNVPEIIFTESNYGGPCSMDEDCKEKEICKGEDGSKTCECADGLVGDNCEINEWCEDNGKFRNCKSANGTCEYIKDRRIVDCICIDAKILDPSENRCRATCNDATECYNGVRCEKKGEYKFCSCDPGLYGDSCEIIFDCTEGKYKECSYSGGTCSYDGNKAICICHYPMKLDDTQHVCKECTCDGEHEECSFKNGRKSCDCESGFTRKNGVCRDTCNSSFKCENGGICFDNFCICYPGSSGDRCEIVFDCTDKGKFKGCDASGGTCFLDVTEAICNCPKGQKYHDQEHVCKECICDGDHEICSFQNETKQCDCESGFIKEMGVCTETCGKSVKCQNEGICVDNSCFCFKGTSGVRCENVFDCTEEGKFKGCEASGGSCIFDRAKAICNCPDGQNYHDLEHTCKECRCDGNGEICNFLNGEKQCDCYPGFTRKNGVCKVICYKDEDCKEEEICKGEDGSKTCECADGLVGDNCEIMEWCEGNGKFRNCKGVNGTCEYIKARRTVDCICPVKKLLDFSENRCRDTCSTSIQCQNGGTCIQDFCFCFQGYIGDRCEIVFDCSEQGKLKGCEASGGTCFLEGDKAFCVCPVHQKYHDLEHVCKECRCDGDNEICSFLNGEKQCNCQSGFARQNGVCKGTCNEDADCKNGGKCEDIFCLCKMGIIGDKCETIYDCEYTGKYKNCESSGGTCYYDGNNSVCSCPNNKKFHNTEHVCKECDCGPKGECNFEGGKKRCYCVPGFAEKGGKCIDTSPCYSNPCMNKGLCENKDGKAICICKAPFWGEFCEEGPCVPNPCLNYGICVSKDRKFVCHCKQPFWGEYCEKDTSPCYSNPCMNNGICENKDGKAICICKEPFWGEFCEEGPCSPNPCLNNGICVYKDRKSVCQCKKPFGGEYCEKVCNCGEKSTQCYYDVKSNKVCICLPGFLEKNGTCSECYCGRQSWGCSFSSRGGKICDCKPGYGQKNGTCVEMCSSSSDCQNEGMCKRFDRGSFCDCGPYFSGDRCEKSEFCDLLKEKCEEIGAVCVPRRWKATCECPKGKMFTPRGICEDVCDSAKCLFGKCEVFGKSYRCKCEEGFSGILCDINNNVKTNISIFGILLFLLCFILIFSLIGITYCGCRNKRSNRCENPKHC